ncbi:MAG: hypothetical protein HYX63_10070 [Gammaproteobacteria bacterium]|nr:hypothetical protein [Gammaproteobacteria bacterium]
MSELLLEAVNAAFLEDRAMLEAQHRNFRERPDGNLVDIKYAAGPNKLLWVLDKYIQEERRV